MLWRSVTHPTFKFLKLEIWSLAKNMCIYFMSSVRAFTKVFALSSLVCGTVAATITIASAEDRYGDCYRYSQLIRQGRLEYIPQYNALRCQDFEKDLQRRERNTNGSASNQQYPNLNGMWDDSWGSGIWQIYHTRSSGEFTVILPNRRGPYKGQFIERNKIAVFYDDRGCCTGVLTPDASQIRWSNGAVWHFHSSRTKSDAKMMFGK